MIKNIRAIFFAVLAFFMPAAFIFQAKAHAAEPPVIDAQSCILIDARSGRSLYERNADEQGLFPASTTKIMTAIIALEKGNPDSLMTASQAAVSDIGKGGMNIGIMAGETIRMENLLEALLISSANETANIIAENICSSREEFIDLMNEKARELGALHTHFTNACGMHDENHYTTARDLAEIARHAMTIPKFREIVRKTEYNMPPTNKHDSWPTLYTTNKLLRQRQSDLFKVTGIKTGYTLPAGYNLVSSAENSEGMELIAVVMGVRNTGAKDNVYKYSEQLLQYGFLNYSTQVLLQEGETIDRDVPVEGAENGASIDLIAESGIKCVLPIDKNDWNLCIRKYVRSPLEAPINRGDAVGFIEYERNGVSLGKTNIIASATVEKAAAPDVPEALKKLAGSAILRKTAYSALIAVAAFLILRTALKIISRRLRSKKRGRLKKEKNSV